MLIRSLTFSHSSIHLFCLNCSHIALALFLQGKGGTRAIHHAAHGDSVSILQLLAQAGADLNARTNAGRSALHVAVNMNRTDSVRRLLELEARPSLQVRLVDHSMGYHSMIL